MATKTPAQYDLLTQGADSYLGALAAIEAFRQEVESICRGAYDRQKVRLLAAMGLGDEECERHDNPCPEDWWAELGVHRSAQDSGQRFYIYLWWSEAEATRPEIKAAVCLDVYPKKLRDQIFDNVRRNNPGRCRIEKDSEGTYFLLLATPMKVDELNVLPERLDDLILEWIVYCESIGGLNLREIMD